MSDTHSETDLAKAGVTRDAEPFNPKPSPLAARPVRWPARVDEAETCSPRG